MRRNTTKFRKFKERIRKSKRYQRNLQTIFTIQWKHYKLHKKSKFNKSRNTAITR